MTEVLGVGILGAGPATQAIHLPTLARMTDRFRVVAIMDVDPDVAAAVAARVAARPSTGMDAVLSDPGVDVVAVCSPAAFHAEQVEAICAAGKRGILCEKPLAMSAEEGRRITATASAAGVPIVVGAMHAYDPGWLVAAGRCGDLLASAHTIRSSIVLPFNDRFENWATEIAAGAAAPPEASTADPRDPQIRAARVAALVMGLLIHDLPLIRRFAPRLDRVDFADFLAPFGGVISLRAAGKAVDLLALMRPCWRAEWRLDVWGPVSSLHIDFTPSYVHAGSATAIIRNGGTELRLGPWNTNGYEGEWADLHEQVSLGCAARYGMQSVVDDLCFATAIADGAAAANMTLAAP